MKNLMRNQTIVPPQLHRSSQTEYPLNCYIHLVFGSQKHIMSNWLEGQDDRRIVAIRQQRWLNLEEEKQRANQKQNACGHPVLQTPFSLTCVCTPNVSLSIAVGSGINSIFTDTDK